MSSLMQTAQPSLKQAWEKSSFSWFCHWCFRKFYSTCCKDFKLPEKGEVTREGIYHCRIRRKNGVKTNWLYAVILDNLTVVVSQIVIKDTGLDTVLHATFFHLPYRYLKRSVTEHLQVIGQWSIVKDGTTPQNC